MRHHYQGTFKDLNGAAVGSSTTSDGNAGTVSVYLARGSTAADVYTASAGGTAVNSVSTDTYGFFEFWVDDSEYDYTQLFKITLSHADVNSKSYDDITIIVNSGQFATDTTAAGAGTDGTISSRSASALGECDGFVKLYNAAGTLVYVPYWLDITP